MPPAAKPGSLKTLQSEHHAQQASKDHPLLRRDCAGARERQKIELARQQTKLAPVTAIRALSIQRTRTLAARPALLYAMDRVFPGARSPGRRGAGSWQAAAHGVSFT